MVSPTPSSGAVMGVRTLLITIISAMDLKAGDVYLVASLSDGQEQRSAVHKKDSTDPNPWWSHNFVFTVDEEAVRTGRLVFRIKKVKHEKHPIGEADVSVRDLLGERGASDEKQKVMSREVRSSSKQTMAVLKFSYDFSEQFPVEAPPADDTITGDPAAAAPPASNLAASYLPPAQEAAPPPATNSVASYPPPAPRAVPPPSTNEPLRVYPVAVASPSAWPPPMPGAAPYTQTAYQANPVPTYGYPPPVHVHPPVGHRYPAPPPPAPYPSPLPWSALYSQPARPANAVPTYGHPMLAHAHHSAGHVYPAPPLPAMYPPPSPWAAQHIQPTYGYWPPACANRPAGHGYPAPTGENFAQRVTTRVAAELLSVAIGSLNVFGSDVGSFFYA